MTEPQTPEGVGTLPVDPLGSNLPVMILRHGDHDDPLVPDPMR